MDEAVIAAIAKWPNVPVVYGWLLLTSRGEWRLRGEPIANAAIGQFISRNYASDGWGRWFFQNGPQRVYVELEVSPWVWRMAAASGVELRAHTGQRARTLEGAWLDETGRLFLLTDIGFGLLDSRDASFAAGSLRVGGVRGVHPEEMEAWLGGLGPRIVVDGGALGLDATAELGLLRARDAPARFGYVLEPQPDPGATAGCT
jgi:Protein of unknown function (DUF2946)